MVSTTAAAKGLAADVDIESLTAADTSHEAESNDKRDEERKDNDIAEGGIIVHSQYGMRVLTSDSQDLLQRQGLEKAATSLRRRTVGLVLYHFEWERV